MQLRQLREVIGPGPSDSELRNVLSRHRDVAAATDAWFGAQEPPRQPAIVTATPVLAPPRPPAADHVSVTVPAGLAGGAQIQVQAPDGRRLIAQVPPGLRSGDQFLVRVPLPGAAPARAVRASQGGQPQQTVVYHHHRGPQYIGAVPYYGYSQPYYDPVLPAAAGFLGGLLIADALFW